jgi:hypothetical protein
MAPKIWLAAELEKMTPSEQDAVFEASIVRTLDGVPPEFLARVRERFEDYRTASESSAR